LFKTLHTTGFVAHFFWAEKQVKYYLRESSTIY